MFNVYKNQQSRQTGNRNLMGPKTLPTIWGTYMKLVTKYQISAINSCWEKCDEKCAYFADFVDFYTHWTYILYMPIFSRIFLSNYWWQKSDIRSQASYRYPILWEALVDPSDSYFLFAEERGYHMLTALPSIVAEKNVTKNEHICLIICIFVNLVYYDWKTHLFVESHYLVFSVMLFK
jgi:hypothetical protein